MLCPECNDVLPQGAKACRSCGLPVRVAAQNKEDDKRSLRFKNFKKIAVFFLLLVILTVAAILFSNSSAGQYLQERISSLQERSLTDESFSVKPGEFTSYKILVPAGAMDVSVKGKFNTALAITKKTAAGTENDGIEVYLLTDAAFAVWRNGYSAGSEYESGRIAEGQINAQLPTGAAVYYLVFSNRFSPHAAKNILANVFLQYKSWLPESLLTLRDRFENWLGL